MHIFHHDAKAICLTGGLGDILTLESHFTYVKNTLETIYWASHSRQILQPLFEQVYPHVNHINVVDDEAVWNTFWAFIGKDDVCQRLPAFDKTKKREELEEQLQGVEDWSIFVIFPMLDALLPYQGSSFLKHKLAEIDHFDLPENYACVQPYTALNRDHHRRVRGYRPDDWRRTRAWLDDRNLHGVILNVGDDEIPDGYIDLSNQTSFGEALEVLKGARGFCGIDSVFSVASAQIFPDEMLSVMYRNTHLWTERRAYYAPKKEFGFLVAG